MKTNLRSAVLGAGFLMTSLFAGIDLNAQTVHKDYIDGEIWFRLKSDKIVVQATSIQNNTKPDLNHLKLSSMPYLRDVFTKHSIKNLAKPFPKAYGFDDLLNTYHLQFADINNVDDIIRELEESGAVEYAEKVPLMNIELSPNDPFHNSTQMWGLFQVQAEQAWNISTGSSSIVVAVVDNTVQINHPDLTNAIWTNTGEIPNNGLDDDNNGYIDDVNGWDAGGTNASNDPDGNINVPSSAWSHGTHCAGTVGAETNNNVGVSSIGFGVSIMPIKATHDGASSTAVTNGYDGVYYAAINNADVISCSWGGTTFSSTGQSVVNFAASQGSIVVAAAGNSNQDNDVVPHYPSSYPNVIAVAATNQSDQKASFSCYGANSVDISAPGTSILSTIPFNNYTYQQGTSMATPMVAGLLGLMKSLNPAITNTALINCLYSSADNIDAQNPSYVGELGAGRINAFQAMNCVAATLSNPPVAQFTANITTISAGGSVTFTDQSTFGPTSWTWNFDNQSLGGVTPATASTQGPHIVTYANPGTYEVSLTVSNANGSNNETKTGYIIVTPPGACNEVNLDDNTFAAPNYGHTGWNLGLYYAPNPGDYISGSNQFGDRASAEYFPSAMIGSNTQFVEGVYFITGNLDNATNPTVTLNVWDATGGSPTTTVLGSRTFNLGDLNANTIYYRAFANPIPLPASSEIAVGFDFSNLNPAAGDTFTVFTNRIGETSTSTGMNQSSTGVWDSYINQYSNNLSHYIFPQLTASPATVNLSAIPTTICEGEVVTYDASGSTYQDTLLWSFPGMTPANSNNVVDSVLYPSAGTYRTYLEVVGGGCSNYKVDSVDITVNPKPVPNLTASADTICSGNSVNLSASGGGTYLWTPGNQTSPSISPSPSTTTTYNVTVTNSGCTGEESRTIYVQNAPTANATFTPSTGVCVNDNVNFDGTSSVDANSYSWTFPAGSPSSGTSTSPFPVISFGASGTHAYTLVVQNGCGTDTHNGTVSVNICTGVEELNKDMLSIFPNPTNNMINVSGLKNVESIILMDVTGKIVYTNNNLTNDVLTIDLSEASNGLYFMQVKSSDANETYKIVKQ